VTSLADWEALEDEWWSRDHARDARVGQLLALHLATTLAEARFDELRRAEEGLVRALKRACAAREAHQEALALLERVTRLGAEGRT
jgi:hypothetical protein